MNHKQLIFAREFRGYSQTDLSKSISGLSQSNLSKFEKGFGVLSSEVIKRIIEYLNFPEDFFSRKINTTIENANYRKRASISKTEIQKFENKCKLIGYLVDEFSESIEWPRFNFPILNQEEGYSPEYVANYTRRLLKLSKDEPIINIFSLLESNGIIIYEFDTINKFDGVSFMTDKGYSLIVINKSFPPDRKRRTIAHELGHILLHNENFPISSYVEKEKEADRFANEFLMPQDFIKSSLNSLKMTELAGLKSYWHTSMASLIRRAKDLGCISADRYKFFSIEMSRSGYNKKEPVDVYIDKPTCFKNAVELFKNELSYSDSDFVKFTSLPFDIIKNLLSFDDIVKLRILK